MNHEIRISKLLEAADKLQMKPYRSDTEYHIASMLFRSVEEWEQAIIEKSKANSSVGSEHTYWLSYGVFHCATALTKLTEIKDKGLDEILDISERVMKDYKPSEMVIAV